MDCVDLAGSAFSIQSFEKRSDISYCVFMYCDCGLLVLCDMGNKKGTRVLRGGQIMNAKEMIENYEIKLYSINQMIKSHEELNKQFGGHDGLILEYACKKELVESTISALSATIPRETAQVKPTEKDWDSWKELPAFNSVVGAWFMVNADDLDCNYPFWLPMPTSPKAEGKEDV